MASRLAAEFVTGVLDPRTDHGSDAAFLADTDPARHSNTAPEAPFTTPESYPQMHGGLA